ncbi:MAG TPA: ABC transporter ATP-binding protein [Anaerolineae bacterium]|nr:ABC transporter ATP-binding protein [Anaerolineae bacterium]
MSSEFIIQAREVSHTYAGGITALQGVTLGIRRNEFLAFVGANGSGKTTLVKHFNGLLKPTRGSLFVNGIDTRKTTVSTLSRTVGFCFQNPDHQIFCYSVWDETLFGLWQQRIPQAEAEERAAQALQKVGLYELRTRHPRELSRGQRQRLATASLLAMETQVLVLDEPTTGQDFNSRRQIMGLAAELHEKGRTIVMVTHDMSLVAEYATRVVAMKGGRVLLDATPRELFQQEDILTATGLKLPPALALARGLKSAGLNATPLTLNELYDAIVAALPEPAKLTDSISYVENRVKPCPR